MSHIKGSRDLATFIPRAGKLDSIEAYLDGDWACDDNDKKSASGRYLMVAGCRLHSHSKTTGQHAFSGGESEIMSVGGLLKQAKLTQYYLEFCGMGLVPMSCTQMPRSPEHCVIREVLEKWTSGIGYRRNCRAGTAV